MPKPLVHPQSDHRHFAASGHLAGSKGVAHARAVHAERAERSRAERGSIRPNLISFRDRSIAGPTITACGAPSRISCRKTSERSHAPLMEYAP
jgi:hypothetical protein